MKNFSFIVVIFSVWSVVLLSPLQANAAEADYTDIFTSNFNISDDVDTLTFDLSRRIPKTEQFVMPVAVLKSSTNLGVTHGAPMDGGQHVTLSGLRQIFVQNGYGSYSLYMRACPANIPFEGSGRGGGCGPTNSTSVEYYPWKLTSPSVEDGKFIFTSLQGKFVLQATATSGSNGSPSLSVLNVFGKPSESLKCVEQKSGSAHQWDCTANAKDEEPVLLTLMNGSEQASNVVAVSLFKSERVDAARFESLCEVYLTEQQGNRYSYEVARKKTREHDALCSGAMVSTQEPARIILQTSSTFTVEAPPTEYFTVFAEKGNGSGPRILHSENGFDATLIMQAIECQTLVKQDAHTFTLLRRNNEGKEVSSCFFPKVSIVSLTGNPRVLSQERSRIVIDATVNSTFELKTSGTTYVEDKFPSPTVGGDKQSDLEKEYWNAIYPSHGEKYEIVASGGGRSPSQTGVFPDVAQSHANAQAIAYLRDKGVISGFPDGTFRPEATINRAEFTKIIVGAVFDKLRIEKCGSTYFKDGVLGEWYNKYVCTAKDEGLIGGYPNGTFRHESAINFVEAAKIITQAFRLPVETEQRDIWYVPFTDALAAKKTIPASIHSIDKQITRGEMAEMVYRLYTGDTTQPSVNYEQLLRDSGVLAAREQKTTNYEWRGSEVPLDILRFTNLETLVLNNNEISHIPEEIGQLKKLQHLTISTVNLSQVPSFVTQWTNLRTLAVEGYGNIGGKLTSLPDNIGSLENLEVLRLHYNSIKSLPPSIGKLRRLKQLDLKRNDISVLPPEIGNLTALEELELSRNPITVWPEEMANLKNLRLLHAPHKTSEEMKAKFKLWFPNATLYYYQ